MNVAVIGVGDVGLVSVLPGFAGFNQVRVPQSLLLPTLLEVRHLFDPSVVEAAGMYSFGAGCRATAAPSPMTHVQRVPAEATTLSHARAA